MISEILTTEMILGSFAEAFLILLPINWEHLILPAISSIALFKFISVMLQKIGLNREDSRKTASLVTDAVEIFNTFKKWVYDRAVLSPTATSLRFPINI